MKTILFFAISFFLITTVWGQAFQDKIIRITYKSIPTSRYQVSSNEDKPEKQKQLLTNLANCYKFYYELLISVKLRQSIYQFDTLIVDKPKELEEYRMAPSDELGYRIKDSTKTYYKKESIFKRTFYTEGAIGDLEWEITNETKSLFGFSCTKAVSKEKSFLITVWFTRDIPIAEGPSNYIGLPGLVIWSEDFFRTTMLDKVEYLPDNGSFTQKFKSIKESFDNQKSENKTKEIIYLFKKASLVKSMVQCKDC